MALSAPRAIYGIHSVTPYNTSTAVFYGMLRVLKGSQFNMQGDQVELRGGSNRFAWKVEDGNINASLDINCQEYPNFIFELFLGKAPSVVTAEASGNVSTLTDKYGTSVVAATGLLGTITVSTAADLKFGKYVVKATGAAAFSVYKASNIDDTRGTDASDYSDDTLLVQSFTGVGAGSTHALTNHGITFTAGASAGAMTSGDTATFSVRPVSTGTSMTVVIGGLTDVFPEFGAVCLAAQLGTQEMCEIDVYKAKNSGFPIGGNEKEFSSWSVNAKCAYDTSKLGIAEIRYSQPLQI